MKSTSMTSTERVLTSMAFREPDRIPFFLLLSMHGAKELGLTIKEYFSRAEYVIEGQTRLLAKYKHDCLNTFFYAAVETEAWGGDVIYYDDGPPNSGAPVIKSKGEIQTIIPPSVKTSPSLQKVLNTITGLKEKVGNSVPILGVVMSPFSLPVMQMGFDKYLDLIYGEPFLFDLLMEKNISFCTEWANAQIKAGATAVCYFDPLSSSSMVPRELFLKTGYQIANRTIAGIKGPIAIHMASGRCLPIVDDIARTGSLVIGAGNQENLTELKSACYGKLTLLGNLNGIEMRLWSRERVEQEVKNAIKNAGKGGGFILADNHGEIPWQVPDQVLTAISETVHTYGNYPLESREHNI